MRIATYLINLDGSDARLASATGQLNAQAIPFTRIPAYDGRKLDPETLDIYDGKAAVGYMGRPLRGGEIGCYFSHVRCVEAFLASDADYALVLEDDMKLEHDLMPLLRAMLGQLEADATGWDLINIGGRRLKYTSPLARFGTVELVHAHYFPMTTTGLVWSRPGAERFLAAQGRIFAPIDNWLRDWQSREDRGLSTLPVLVSTTDAASDIDGGTAKRNRSGRSAFYGLRKQKRILGSKLQAIRHKLRRMIRKG